MKTLLLIASLLPFFVLSQTDTLPRNTETGKYEYSDVVSVDSVTADKLYSNAKIFMVDAFKSSKDVTQLNDDVAKTVAGRGTTKIEFKGIGLSGLEKYVRFKVYIQCKENRYKYTFNSFSFSMISSSFSGEKDLEDESYFTKRWLTKKQYQQLMSQVSETMNLLIADLKKHMASQVGSTKDW